MKGDERAKRTNDSGEVISFSPAFLLPSGERGPILTGDDRLTMMRRSALSLLAVGREVKHRCPAGVHACLALRTGYCGVRALAGRIAGRETGLRRFELT